MAKSILIIDDEKDVRNSLRHVFEFHGYKVFEACNGKEGLDVYRRNMVDIVITDILMPEKDGLETILDIKKEFPKAKIIAMSGFGKGGMDILSIAREFGATHCIRKPFQPDEIIRLVNSTLDVPDSSQ
ncbi:MAG: response regulator [Dissulfurispiraceae bacterium]